jgi:hypothetical protein
MIASRGTLGTSGTCFGSFFPEIKFLPGDRRRSGSAGLAQGRQKGSAQRRQRALDRQNGEVGNIGNIGNVKSNFFFRKKNFPPGCRVIFSPGFFIFRLQKIRLLVPDVPGYSSPAFSASK